MLEASLLRGEERLSQLASAANDDQIEAAGGPSPDNRALPSLLVPDLPEPQTKEDGHQRWTEFLRDRFVRGADDDFDYSGVDDNDEYDVLERTDREEAWFDEEDPAWASDEGQDRAADLAASGTNSQLGEREIAGQTGVQDF
jgi:hypothetical protein